MDKANKPHFSPSMTVQEFNQHYWYKEELRQLCKKYNLSSYGTKAELIERIKEFLMTGKAITDVRKENYDKRQKSSSKEITLETRLIPDGFKFNQQAREFFKQYYGVSKFSFTKHMAAALREAEKNNNLQMTVADLMKVYENGKKGQQTTNLPEEQTYQWNNFVKDFHRDTKTKDLHPKMEVAALLWQAVKQKPGSKKYRSELLKTYKDEIEVVMKNK
ncbi:SAP domain-containing protein [Pseudogracilibacillus auburnensis]|uniref:SAP domain-containing protein n=1 Tax=Pseudogracilibacillus auburnensis TaxID=1494959 RepID=A0A2V3VG98_9BACI|nr:SAP domain-containing protein [Pseudogracilibacillus auburnensis]PXW80836.1 SAP domain-containing protein [Pseudogracilibacillus auburnensis]